MSGYSCSKCGAPVLVANGTTVRACAHAAPILAHLAAVVSQDGGVSPKREPQK